VPGAARTGGIAASSLRRRLKLEPVADRQDIGGKLARYEQINALPPASIGKKSAHIIGGGIGGLSPSWRGVIEERLS
jgi:hypothetical protein